MVEERERRWRDWMVAAQSDDAKAYEKLLLELRPHLCGLVRRQFHASDGLEDVVQNAFLSIHRARHTYRPERPFGPWVRAVARNAAIDHLRRHARRVSREVSMGAPGVPEPSVEPSQARQLAALSQELSRALAEIPARQREAVELIQLRGLSVAEAAVRVGVSRGALKLRAHRGYRALRERLAHCMP
jgi:RNA polymerase sigma-70 factor (ECF subfamily)